MGCFQRTSSAGLVPLAALAAPAARAGGRGGLASEGEETVAAAAAAAEGVAGGVRVASAMRQVPSFYILILNLILVSDLPISRSPGQ